MQLGSFGLYGGREVTPLYPLQFWPRGCDKAITPEEKRWFLAQQYRFHFWCYMFLAAVIKVDKAMSTITHHRFKVYIKSMPSPCLLPEVTEYIEGAQMSTMTH